MLDLGVCASALAAEDFSDLVDPAFPNTLAAFEAAAGLVWPVLFGACARALAAADFSAAVDLGFDRTLLALDAAFAPVCLLFLAVIRCS
ncbi:hypothetical protein [Lentzea cavernae]|uniref:hypothetical protein n=1 Tax=Lentzea cavernae TaxID=2020703 RepID=UPI001749F3E7|nr:hypothetical protein [Lentzea cavernae]